MVRKFVTFFVDFSSLLRVLQMTELSIRANEKIIIIAGSSVLSSVLCSPGVPRKTAAAIIPTECKSDTNCAAVSTLRIPPLILKRGNERQGNQRVPAVRVGRASSSLSRSSGRRLRSPLRARKRQIRLRVAREIAPG